MKQSSSKAFTLIEVITSLSIFSICMAMAVSAFFATSKIFFFTRVLDLAHNQVRGAADKISTLNRQSLYYPTIYSNTSFAYNPGLAISGFTTNEIYTSGTGTNAVTSVNVLRFGNEVRIMYEGYASTLTQNIAIGADTITVSNTGTLVSVATVPTVFGTITAAASVSNTANNLRLTPATFNNAGYDSCFIVMNNTLANASITNTISTNANVTIYQLGAPFSNPANTAAPAGAQIYVGKTGRFIVLNQELRFYPALNSSQYDTLMVNVTSEKPFYVTQGSDTSESQNRGPLLTIDLAYSSPGDITGKGVYRIVTRSCMRTDPSSKNSNTIATGGVNSEADNNDN